MPCLCSCESHALHGTDIGNTGRQIKRTRSHSHSCGVRQRRARASLGVHGKKFGRNNPRLILRSIYRSDARNIGAVSARARNDDTNESEGVVFAEVVKDGAVLPELVTGKGSKKIDEDNDDMDANDFLTKLKQFDVSPEVAAIILVYFVQGVLGLSRLAVNFFLKDELDISPAMMTVLTGISTIPWLVKPLWGFLSDSVPLFGYRRRSYLFLCGVLGALGWAGMATAVTEPKLAVAMLTLGSLGTAASDVVVDSVVVERARGERQSKAGELQSICWASAAVGGLVSAYFSGSLVQEYGTRYVFGVTALLPLLTAGSALLVNEKRVEPSQIPDSTVQAAKDQGMKLWQAAKQKSIWVPTIFVFLWQATPTAESAMFYFTTNELGFTPEFLGRVRLVTSFASLAGIALYNFRLKDVPLKTMFFWTAITGTVLGLTQLLLITGMNRELGIDDRFFAMGDSLVLTVLGQLAFMPTLVLAAKICPPGLEATLFAGLMSVFNAGGVASGALGAGLTEYLGVTSTNFDNLALLVTLCNLSSLAPLPFLFLLNEVTDQEKKPRNNGAGTDEVLGGFIVEEAPQLDSVVGKDKRI